MNKINWIFKNGTQNLDCTSFPYAFRMMHGVVRKAIADGKPVNTATLSILGPQTENGRKTYSYHAACALATEQGLLEADGNLNSREFKKK